MPESRASNLQQWLRETLGQQVLGGKWPAGGRLPSERQLATDFGVSRASVREAIQHLVARGLLSSRRGSGIYVRPAPAAEPLPAPAVKAPPALPDSPLWRADILEFRLIFECGAARLAAVRADPAQRQELGEWLARMQQAVAAGDVDAEAEADAGFHELLAASAHNLMIHRFHAIVINALRPHITHNTYDASRRPSPRTRQQSLDRMQQHLDIYSAIMERSPEQAAEAMRRHILFVGAQFVSDSSSHAFDIYRRPGASH